MRPASTGWENEKKGSWLVRDFLYARGGHLSSATAPNHYTKGSLRMEKKNGSFPYASPRAPNIYFTSPGSLKVFRKGGEHKRV